MCNLSIIPCSNQLARGEQTNKSDSEFCRDRTMLPSSHRQQRERQCRLQIHLSLKNHEILYVTNQPASHSPETIWALFLAPGHTNVACVPWRRHTRRRLCRGGVTSKEFGRSINLIVAPRLHGSKGMLSPGKMECTIEGMRGSTTWMLPRSMYVHSRQ